MRDGSGEDRKVTLFGFGFGDGGWVKFEFILGIHPLWLGALHLAHPVMWD